MNIPGSLGDSIRTKSVNRFPWRTAATLSVLLMELTIVVAWIELVASPLGPAPLGILILWFTGFALVANRVTFWSERGQLPRVLVGLLSIVFLLIGLLISLNLVDSSQSMLDLRGAIINGLESLMELLPPSPQVLVMGFAVYIWRRGAVSASSKYLEQGRTGFKFRVGVLIFILYTFIRGRSFVPPALPLFFFSSLLAMSLTRANQVTRQSAGGDPPFSLTWFLSLAVLFLMTTVTGLLAGQFFSSRLIDRLLGGLRQIFLQIFLFIYQLILPLLLVLDALFQRWVENLTQEPESVDSGPFEELLGHAGDWVGRDPPLFLERFNDFLTSLAAYWPTIQFFLISLIVLIVFVSSIRLVLRRSRRVTQERIVSDQGEVLPFGVMADWRRRIGKFGEEIRGWGQAAVSGQLTTAILVRRLYGRMLHLAAEYGRSRYRWETPLEFQAVLVHLFPKTRREIETLTAAYVEVRYGELLETSDLVDSVRAAWGRVLDEYGK